MNALALAPDRDDRPHEDHFDELARYLDRPTSSAAIRDYRDALRG